MQKYSLLLFTLLLIHQRSFSQEKLTLEGAIDLALEKNYAIQVANQNLSIAEMQIYKANAGLTPTLDWNANLGTNVNYVDQKFFDGRSINRLSRTYLPNTNLALSWTLYDGRRMQTNYEILKSQGQQQVVQKKLVVQNTISSVMQAYYEILRQKQSVEYLKAIINYYNERLNLTQQRWEIGRGSKLDYLQSKSDLMAQQVTLVQTENMLNEAKIQLNRILGRNPNEVFEIEEVASIQRTYNLSELLTEAKSHNQDILLLQKNIELNLLNEKVTESFRKPRLALNSSFGYALTNSNAGLLLLNQSIGLNTGLSMTWNIFNGHQTQRNIEIAKINTAISRNQQSSLLQQIETDLLAAYNQFTTDKELLSIEEENKKVSEENLTISLEKFKLGGSTILELNEAQRRFDTSLNRLVNNQYNLKVSELELLRLSGELVQ